MGRRKVTIRQTAADSISQVAWFIESKGMLATAEKFSDAAYDFIEAMGNSLLTYAVCKDPNRMMMGLKCKSFKKKYTIVFIETSKEIVVTEFIPSKTIHW